MWTNALRTTEDAVNLQPVPTYLTASFAPVILDTLVMVLPAQVRYYCYRGRLRSVLILVLRHLTVVGYTCI